MKTNNINSEHPIMKTLDLLKTQDDDVEAKKRAEWLNEHNAPSDWVILTTGEIAVLKAALPKKEDHIDGILYGLGYAEGGSKPYAMVHVTWDEVSRVGGKLNGKAVTIIPTS